MRRGCIQKTIFDNYDLIDMKTGAVLATYKTSQPVGLVYRGDYVDITGWPEKKEKEEE